MAVLHNSHSFLIKEVFKNTNNLFIFLSIFFSLFLTAVTVLGFNRLPQKRMVLGAKTSSFSKANTETAYVYDSYMVSPPPKIPTPTRIPTITQIQSPVNKKFILPKLKQITPTPNISQYTARQIDSKTFEVTGVSNDNNMSSGQELVSALNKYRQEHGAGALAWDSGLAGLASDRVNTFASKGSLDGHAGFTDFMNNGGFAKLGFNGLGENSAYLSGPMSGDKIIRDIFGADAPHDHNQLDPSWTHVGAAISGKAVNVNFGKGKH